jgi:hypothetical protein
MHFLHIAFGRQLAVGERLANVTGDHRLVAAEQLDHLPLREPDRIALEADVETDLTIGGLVEDHFAAAVLRGIAHAILERSEGCRTAQG